MSCRAARSRLPVPPAGRHSGRGPATARRSDREHPHPHRWSLLLQACAGPVCPGRGDKAGRSALPSRPCIGHIIGAGSRQHQLRYRHSLTQKRRRRLSTCGQIASSLRVGPKAASSLRVSDRTDGPHRGTRGSGLRVMQAGWPAWAPVAWMAAGGVVGLLAGSPARARSLWLARRWT